MDWHHTHAEGWVSAWLQEVGDSGVWLITPAGLYCVILWPQAFTKHGKWMPKQLSFLIPADRLQWRVLACLRAVLVPRWNGIHLKAEVCVCAGVTGLWKGAGPWGSRQLHIFGGNFVRWIIVSWPRGAPATHIAWGGIKSPETISGEAEPGVRGWERKR